MASIRRQISIDTTPQEAWSALRDWGALHKRLASGFVIDTRVDGNDRIVTFFTGTVVRERIVTVDNEARCLVWSIVDGPYEHHNGSAQVFADDDGVNFVWITDLLPDELAAPTAQAMERGLTAVKETLERARNRRSAGPTLRVVHDQHAS